MTVEIRSPMAGTVIAVDVSTGQTVAAGAVLAVVEAMKMHHSLHAEHGGRVEDIRVKPGDIVAAAEAVILLDHWTSPTPPRWQSNRSTASRSVPICPRFSRRRAKLLAEDGPADIARRTTAKSAPLERS